MLGVDVVVSGEEFPFLRETNIRLGENERSKKRSISPSAPESPSKSHLEKDRAT
jgi:hypothetical protein